MTSSADSANGWAAGSPPSRNGSGFACFPPMPLRACIQRWRIASLATNWWWLSDDGGVYLGDHAWLMCLYALKDYRRWASACRTAVCAAGSVGNAAYPLLLETAEPLGFRDLCSANRRANSNPGIMAALKSDENWRWQLSAVNPPEVSWNRRLNPRAQHSQSRRDPRTHSFRRARTISRARFR